MRHRYHIRRAVSLFWATSVFFVYLSALINFHQHHIWQKQLIPEFYIAKREKEKSITFSSDDQGQISHLRHHGMDFWAVTPAHQSLISIIIQPSVLIDESGTEALPASCTLLCASLRAPPLC